MGIHWLLLRWLLEPEFLSQGCSKILHSIIFRILFIFFFFQAGIRGFGVESILQTLGCGVKRMEYFDSSQFWDRFYQLLRLIPHLSILILFLFTFWRNFSGLWSQNLKIIISSIYILLQSCYDLKFGNSLVNFEFSFHVCCVKDELLRLSTCENYVNQRKIILDHFSLMIRIFMHFAGFSWISRKNMKFYSIPGFSRDLESWIDPMTRFLEPRYCRVFLLFIRLLWSGNRLLISVCIARSRSRSSSIPSNFE